MHAHVIGEHGTSQVYLWSTAHVAGTPLLPSLLPNGVSAEAFRKDVENDVRYANIDIIEGTGASQLGIVVVTARIVEIIGRDERLAVPIGAYQKGSDPRIDAAIELWPAMQKFLMQPIEQRVGHQDAVNALRQLFASVPPNPKAPA